MFQEAAERFHEEAGISSGQDLSNMDDRINIRDNIQVKHQLSIQAIFKDAFIICVTILRLVVSRKQFLS